MKHIYSIVKEGADNVAIEYVTSSRALLQTELLILKQCLKEVEADDMGNVSLDKLVSEAVERFHEKTGRHLSAADGIIDGQIRI